VLVERHRDDAERLRERAHAEAVEPVAVGDGERGRDDPVDAQRLARRIGP
jgi:hypothetical protein